MENSLLSNIEASVNENPLYLLETEIMQPKGARKNQQSRTQHIPVPINVGLMSVKSEPAYDFFLAPEALEHVTVNVVGDSIDLAPPLYPSGNDFSTPGSVDNFNVSPCEPSTAVADFSLALEPGSAESTLEADFSVQSPPVHMISSNLVLTSSSVSSSQNNCEMVQVRNTQNSNEVVSSKETVGFRQDGMENQSSSLDENSASDDETAGTNASNVNNINGKIAELQRQLKAAIDEKKRIQSKNSPGPSKRRRVEVHTEENSFRCTFRDCSHAAKNARYLKLHLETHSEEKGLRCSEPDCTYKTKTTTALRKHKASHKFREQFKCKLCSSTFSSNDAVRVHIRIHTKEKPFKCPEPNCTYAGSQKVHLETHKNLKHSE